MKDNNEFKTRIKKYSKLRAKIEHEIQELKLKNENNEKINYYRDILKKIDISIFQEAKKRTNQLFPNFQSLIQVGEKTKNDNLEKEKNEIQKWIEAIQLTNEEKNTKNQIEDYVGNSNNEEFVKNVIANWQNERQTQIKQLQQLIAIKEKFKQHKLKEKISINKINVLKGVRETNNQVEMLNDKLKQIIRENKVKSRKWFIFACLLTVFSAICLLVIFLT